MRGRLTYANVVATLALILAMGGTAYAAATVTSRDIVNHTIRLKDMSDTAVFDLLPNTQNGIKNDGGTLTGNSPVTVATLDIAGDGNFIVLAKLWLRNDAAGVSMLCSLDGGQTGDLNHTILGGSGAAGSTESMSFMIGEFFDVNESATIHCNPSGGTVHVFDIKMTAIEAGGGADEPL